jgi:hypothetical protein
MDLLRRVGMIFGITLVLTVLLLILYQGTS